MSTPVRFNATKAWIAFCKQPKQFTFKCLCVTLVLGVNANLSQQHCYNESCDFRAKRFSFFRWWRKYLLCVPCQQSQFSLPNAFENARFKLFGILKLLAALVQTANMGLPVMTFVTCYSLGRYFRNKLIMSQNRYLIRVIRLLKSFLLTKITTAKIARNIT